MSPAPTAKMSKGKRPSGTKPGESSVDSGDDDPPAGNTDWSNAVDKDFKRKERIVKRSRKHGGLHELKSASNPKPAPEDEVEEEMHVYWAEDGTVQFWKG